MQSYDICKMVRHNYGEKIFNLQWIGKISKVTPEMLKSY